METEVAVVGAGPGGYVAALRLADLGKEVVLIEERERPGGTCLLEGCIPSKALIHAVEVVESAKRAAEIGLEFGPVEIHLDRLRAWSASVVDVLVGGVEGLLKRRGVELVHGRAQFKDRTTLLVDGSSSVRFRDCIVATGSSLNLLPAGYDSSVWSSADALKLPRLPESLLVVGGGYIGLEMGLVYAGLGTRVSVVEFFPRLLMGADADLVDIMVKEVGRRLHEIMIDSKVLAVEKTSAGYAVRIEHQGQERREEYEQVLVAIGRRPNTGDLGLAAIGVEMNERGVVTTDGQCRTTVPRIYAIGDITAGPMLAHKASREGKVAAEVIAQQHSEFDNRAIPAVVFTDPEIAWSGLTEAEAERDGIQVKIGRFPLRALGRARTLGRADGMVKVLSEPDSGLILGVGMVGPAVSELIAEGTLALEMGATLEDLMVTIHPHPTISEALQEAAEVAAGAPTHVNPPRRRE